jgi:hypothetical protein
VERPLSGVGISIVPGQTPKNVLGEGQSWSEAGIRLPGFLHPNLQLKHGFGREPKSYVPKIRRMCRFTVLAGSMRRILQHGGFAEKCPVCSRRKGAIVGRRNVLLLTRG